MTFHLKNFLDMIWAFVAQRLAGLLQAISDRPKRIRRISDIDEAKQILTVKRRPEALKQRSEPNKRLKDTFGIENAFTTFHLTVYEDFVKKVKKLVKFESYAALRDVVSDIFIEERDLLSVKYGSEIPYKEFLMISVFKISVNMFLGEYINRDISKEEMSELCLTAAQQINDLWLQSKNNDVKEAEKHLLFQSLQKLFPSLEVRNDQQNPLTLIIPSFETLWRILYRLTVQIKCLEENESQKTIELFQTFEKDPSKNTFIAMRDGISVENIVKEILFLYPPTRSIYRKHESGETIIIDVAEMHRKSVSKDENTFSYYPQRWAAENSRNLPFFSFGFSKFECPAKPTFAPAILGISGATLFKIFENYSWLNSEKNQKNFADNDRTQYKEFYLKKVD